MIATGLPATMDVKRALDSNGSQATEGLKLDFGCGRNIRDKFEGVDRLPLPGVKHVVDLWRFPWPWEDSSVSAIHCQHLLEFMPQAFVARDGVSLIQVPESPEDQDLFFAFFDECFRILKPGALMTVVVPCGRHNLSMDNPCHRRSFVETTWLSLHEPCRLETGMDAVVRCNFDYECAGISSLDQTVFHPEARARRQSESWNVISKWVVTLRANKEPGNGLVAIGSRCGTDKGTFHSYLGVYEELLSPWRDKDISILEIGTWTGRSARMWLQYFPSARIIGLDIGGPPLINDDRFTFHQINQRDQKKLRTLVTDGTLDVVIDDGSHDPEDQRLSFEALWPKVRKGGIYFIEDIQSEASLPYWESRGAKIHKLLKNGRYDDILVVLRK